jgi:hypothetical protein
MARPSALAALSLGQGIPTPAVLWIGAAGALPHPNRGASAPTTVTLAPAADEERCDAVLGCDALAMPRRSSSLTEAGDAEWKRESHAGKFTAKLLPLGTNDDYSALLSIWG